MKENKRFEVENYQLKCRIKLLEEEFKTKKGAVELELLLKDKLEMESE